jgi:hypothetical protein
LAAAGFSGVLIAGGEVLMGADIEFMIVLVLVACVVVIGGTLVFAVWAVVYFGGRVYRQATRSHLYVPVTARVTRTYLLNAGSIVSVEYEYGGAKIVNRFDTTGDIASLAEQSGQIALRIDPDYPKDVLVDPAFKEAAAAAAAIRAGTGIRAKTFSGYALRLLGCMLPAAGVGIGLVWLKVVPLWQIAAASALLAIMYLVLLRDAWLHFRAKDGDCGKKSPDTQGRASPE